MKTISIIAKKGGVGKTAISVNLAVCARLDGFSAVVVDIDPQASSCVWADARDFGDTHLPSVPVISIAASRLTNALADCRDNNIDVVVVDTAPSADSGIISAAKHADFCLLPSKPGLADLSSLKDTIELLKVSDTTAATILTMAKTKGLSYEGLSALKTLPLPTAPIQLSHRVVWPQSFGGGWGICEFEPKGKAALELNRLWRWVKEQLGGPISE